MRKNFKFQTKVTHMIFTCEISTISWIAFRTVTSEWQGERPRVRQLPKQWYLRTWELSSGDQVSGVWWRSDISDCQWHTISWQTRGAFTLAPDSDWREERGERRARGIIWYHRNMETRLTRGRSQDSGMCRTFGSIFTNNCRFLIFLVFVISINFLLCTLKCVTRKSLL